MSTKRRSRSVTSRYRRRKQRQLLHAVEQLEDRRVLNGDGLSDAFLAQYAELLGADQTFVLDFDGELDLTYDGPVRVEGIDVPAFDASAAGLDGAEQEVISGILATLEESFAETSVVFTANLPEQGTPYSTLYVGGNGHKFSQYGTFLGLAEQADVGNSDETDNAFVFSDAVGTYVADSSAEDFAIAVSEVIVHEAAHLVGWRHPDFQKTGQIQSVALVATPQITVEAIQGGGFRIDWDDVGAAGYRLYRSRFETGPWEQDLDRDLVRDAQIYFGSDTVRLDRGSHLQPGGTYYYTVRALGAASLSNPEGATNGDSATDFLQAFVLDTLVEPGEPVKVFWRAAPELFGDANAVITTAELQNVFIRVDVANLQQGGHSSIFPATPTGDGHATIIPEALPNAGHLKGFIESQPIQAQPPEVNSR